MGRFYPGIPDDYLDWPEHIKRAWLDNIPRVLAVEKLRELELDISTPEGLANLIKLATKDEELAEKVRVESIIQRKMTTLSALGGSWQTNQLT